MRRYPARDIWFLLKCAVLLALTRLGLFVFSFQSVLRVVGRLSRTFCGDRRSRPSDAIVRIGWAVTRASHSVPGARHCLTKALAAKLLLARLGSPTQLRIGVAKDRAGRLTAHAWLEAEGVAIFGATQTELEEFAVLPHLDRAR